MRLVGHELVADLGRLVRNGYALPEASYFCTSTASKWLYPDAPDHGLEHLALRLSNMPQWRPIASLDIDDFDRMSDEDLGNRCGGDAEASLRLFPRLAEEIKTRGLSKIWRLAMAVLPVLATVGGTGMAVDRDRLADRVVAVGRKTSEERAALEKLLGIEAKPGSKTISHDQLADVIYKPPFNAVAMRKTTTGYSTDRISLLWARYKAREEKNQQLDDVLTRLLDYGEQSKLLSTYYKPWLDSGAGLRVYSCYSLGGTATGRLSSYDTNLQNVPSDARELIVPSDGYDLIVQADFKQLELCTAGELSGDKTLFDWISRGLDIHALQAARVLGLKEPHTKDEIASFKEQFKTERQIGKRANFATLYGVSADSLAWQIFKDAEGAIWIPPDQVQPYIDMFFKTFTGWKAHSDRLRQKLARQEPITSPTGRSWLLPNSEAGWRQACNYGVQSLASDLVLLVLWSLYNILKRDGWKTRIIGEVHDSIVLETTKKELPGLLKLMKHVCEHPDTSSFGFKLRVPLAIELQKGLTWASLVPA